MTQWTVKEKNGTYTAGGWQIVGPNRRGVLGDGDVYWLWSASGDYGARSESGTAETEDEARTLAQEAHRRLNP